MGFPVISHPARFAPSPKSATSTNPLRPPLSRWTPPLRASHSTRPSAPSPPARPLCFTMATPSSAAAGSAEISMAMLDWNVKKVQNLTSAEIWLFIVARVLVGFAAGILVTQYFPGVAALVVFPALAIGVVLFAIAARGLWRQTQPDNGKLIKSEDFLPPAPPARRPWSDYASTPHV